METPYQATSTVVRSKTNIIKTLAPVIGMCNFDDLQDGDYHAMEAHLLEALRLARQARSAHRIINAATRVQLPFVFMGVR